MVFLVNCFKVESPLTGANILSLKHCPSLRRRPQKRENDRTAFLAFEAGGVLFLSVLENFVLPMG